MMPPAPNLTRTVVRLRNKIERTDDALMALLVRRVELARQVGRAKERAGLPMLDPAREARVVRWAAARARELGIPQESVRALFWGIIAMCRNEQVRETRAPARRATRRTSPNA
jgi:chorismate mutase